MNWLGRTLTRKFALLLAGFLALQALQLGIGIFGVLHVGEESAAINEAGRQRMRMYHLLYLAHEALEYHSWPSEGRKIVDGVLADYDAESDRLDALAGRSAKYKKFRETIAAVRVHWDGEIKPLLLAFDPSNPQAAVALARFEAQVPGHVRHLDEVVNLLEQDAAEDARGLAIFQAVILGLTLLLGAAGFVMARYVVSLPLRRLIEATRSIATGAYDRRVTVSSRDEIGELAGTFNRMAEAVRERNSHILGLKQYAEDIIASLPAGLLVLDHSLKVLSVNRSFRELFGLRNGDDVAGRDIEELLPLPELREQVQGVFVSGTAVHGIEAALDGKRLRLAITGIRLAEEEEEEDRLLVVVEDVTAEHELRVQARAHEQRFYDLVQGLDAVVWEAEVRGEEIRFTFISDHVETLLGYPVQRWLGHEFWPAVVHPDDRDAVFDFYNRVLERGGGSRERFEIEYRARRADGGLLWLHDVVHLTPGGEGPGRLRGVMMDISARKEMEARLAHLANHDPLTGLPNRHLLADRLGQALISAARHGRAAGALFLDLDRFKVINDSLGHSAGDRLLKAVAERLQDGVREGDTVARLGGDEFVMILDDMAQPQDAALVAQKILESFVQPFHVEIPEAGGAQEFFFTTSIGISLYPSDGEDVDTLLKNADTAMYRAKERGGNSYQFFTPEMDLRARKRLSLESALRNALERREFVLHYQPQIDLATQRVIGVEALLRWNHPERGLVAPADFIPLLEETGLIVPVGEWVLREACTQATAWRAAGLPPLRVAGNLSARQLRHECFADTVAAALADTGMDPGDLELEITESAVMQQVEASIETLSRIHALGVRLSMDDFGTGYSSLSHLKLLPIDAVKIDRSFVHDIPGDEDDTAIVQAIIVLARTLRLDVIAEGVETKEQLAFLRAHGCDAMQGYLFSRPLPAEALRRLLEQGKRLPLD